MLESNCSKEYKNKMEYEISNVSIETWQKKKEKTEEIKRKGINTNNKIWVHSSNTMWELISFVGKVDEKCLRFKKPRRASHNS